LQGSILLLCDGGLFNSHFIAHSLGIYIKCRQMSLQLSKLVNFCETTPWTKNDPYFIIAITMSIDN